jgi:hypothetical protein
MQQKMHCPTMCFLRSDIVCFQTVTIIHYVTNGPGSIPDKYTNKEIAKINCDKCILNLITTPCKETYLARHARKCTHT